MPMDEVKMETKGRAFDRIPLVDISALFGSDAGAKQNVAAEIADAAANVGFLYVTGHGIPALMIEKLLERAAEFFALPVDVKKKYYIGNSRAHRGYVPMGEENFYAGELASVDKKEAFDLSIDLPADDPDHIKGYRLLGPNQWPAEVPSFKADVYGYYRAVIDLSQTLFRDAPPVPGAFVINIGDMLEVLTNGRFIATPHRVRDVPQERFSFPLFCAVDYDTVIEPLPEFRDENAQRYPHYVAGDHLLAQTMKTFAYLRQLQKDGVVAFPESEVASDIAFGRKETA